MKPSRVDILDTPSPRDLADINALLPQTAARPHLLSMKELQRIIRQGAHCRLVVARHRRGKSMPIVGMASVTLSRIPTGLMAIIEDVVVEESFQRRGLGRMMTEKLIDIARKARAKHISLKTNPSYHAANAMYRQLGFVQRDANLYRINLTLPKPSSPAAVARALGGRHRPEG